MATFAIGGTTSTFKAVVRGSSQDAVEPERFTVTMHFASLAEWNDAVALTTSRWHIHQPLGGTIIVDVARGAGVGALSIENFGSTSALLTELRATTYLPGGAQRQASATFVRTAPWT
jgi:hypothetical protein